ncbi:hypothetical protein UlMin_024461 [Ulmus minor]
MKEDEDPCCEPLFWEFLSVSMALMLFACITSSLTLGLLSFSKVDLEVLIKADQPQAQKYAAKILQLVKNEHLLLCTLLVAKSLDWRYALSIFMDTIFPIWIALFISIIFVLVFAEIIPQALCSRYGLSVGAKLFVLVQLLMVLFFPVAYPISKLLALILGKEHYVLLKSAELKTLVALPANEVGKGGELSHQEMSIISGAFDLTQKTVEDAMTPISETFSLDINSKMNLYQTMGLISSKGHSRIPIYSGDPKNINGLILVKNLIFYHSEDETPVKQMTLKTMPRIYDYLSLYDILGQFVKCHYHMAIVLKSRGIQCIENNAAEIYSSEIEPQSATLQNVMEQDKNFTPRSNSLEQGGETTPFHDLDEEVVGIITLEEVMEALLQENILDETDAYIDVHNK